MLHRLVLLSTNLLLIGAFTASTVKAQNNSKKIPDPRDIETEAKFYAWSLLPSYY
jgi:hypothetical protein